MNTNNKKTISEKGCRWRGEA